MDIQKIFSKKVAIKLVSMGNQILYTEPNKKFPKLKVFCFVNTDKLNNDWNSLK